MRPRDETLPAATTAPVTIPSSSTREDIARSIQAAREKYPNRPLLYKIPASTSSVIAKKGPLAPATAVHAHIATQPADSTNARVSSRKFVSTTEAACDDDAVPTFGSTRVEQSADELSGVKRKYSSADEGESEVRKRRRGTIQPKSVAPHRRLARRAPPRGIEYAKVAAVIGLVQDTFKKLRDAQVGCTSG